jgi:hypothetical protein
MKGRAVTELIRAAGPTTATTPWPLTELDTINSRFLLRGTWVFAKPLDPNRLKAGLAKLLSDYPPLGARLAKGKEVVRFDSGVPFTVAAEPDAYVSDVLDRPERADRYANKPSVGALRRGSAPPYTVRLTRLRDGCVLSVCCSHALLDGNGFYSMVRNWSRVCTGRDYPRPVFDTSVIPPAGSHTKAERLALAHAQGWDRIKLGGILKVVLLLLTGRLLVRSAPIRFSDETLRRLTEDAARESGRSDISTHTALSAHVTRMFTKLFGLPAGTPCLQVTVLDMRERLPGVPANYGCNAAWAARTAEFSAGVSLGELARISRDGLAPWIARPSEKLAELVPLARELVSQGPLLAPYDLGRMHATRPTLVYVNDFSRFPIYDVDFGDEGRPATPARVIPHDLPDPVLFWPAPPSEGGVEVYLTGVAAVWLKNLHPEDPWRAEMRYDATRE